MKCWSTYRLNRAQSDLVQKLQTPQPIKKLLAFHATPSFITLFTKSRHLSYPKSDKPSAINIYIYLFAIHCNIILSCTRRSSKRYLPSGFPTNTSVHLTSLPSVVHALLFSPFNNLINLIIFGEMHKSWSSSLRNFHQFLIIPSLLTLMPSQHSTLHHRSPCSSREGGTRMGGGSCSLCRDKSKCAH